MTRFMMAVCLAALACAVGPRMAHADAQFIGIDPATPHRALADFLIISGGANNGDLQITLTNQSTGQPSGIYATADGLTAILFNVTGSPNLTPVSAVLAGGSSILNGSGCSPACTGTTTNVGGEWVYGPDTAAGSFFPAADEDIASSSFGIFTTNGNFPPGTNLSPGTQIDGIDFAEVGSDYVSGIPNPIIERSTVFTLSGFGGHSLSDINSITFLYGTNDSHAIITGDNVHVPEPASLALLGSGLLALGLYRRRYPRG